MRLVPARITVVLIAMLCPSAHGQNTESAKTPINEAKGVPPRATPGDYQAHAQVGKVTIAAEFMGHAIPRAEGPLSTDDYVVIETGFFGPPGARITLSAGDFSLRVNGKKTPLASQPYGFVLRSVQDPSWAPPVPPESKSKTSFGTGGQGGSNSPPPVVHVPIELQRAMAQHVQRASLPEGERALPEAGLIFFQYRGKTQNIHSLELIYSGPAGKATMALQP